MGKEFEEGGGQWEWERGKRRYVWGCNKNAKYMYEIIKEKFSKLFKTFSGLKGMQPSLLHVHLPEALAP